MRKGLARFLTVAAVLVVTGSVTGAAADPADDGITLRQLHDTLAAAANAGDIAKTDATLAELDQVLATMSGSGGELAALARDETAAARDRLAGQFPAGTQPLGVSTIVAAVKGLLTILLALRSMLTGIPIASIGGLIPAASVGGLCLVVLC